MDDSSEADDDGNKRSNSRQNVSFGDCDSHLGGCMISGFGGLQRRCTSRRKLSVASMILYHKEEDEAGKAIDSTRFNSAPGRLFPLCYGEIFPALGQT